MPKVEVKGVSNSLSAELLNSNQLILSITNNDELRVCLFEKIIDYETLASEIKFLFQNMGELFQAIKNVVTKGKCQDILIQNNGKVHISFEVQINSKTTRKAITFALEKRINGDEELNLLRANLQSARVQIAELKARVKLISDDNDQLKVKFNYLEQIVLAQTVNKGYQKNQTEEKKQEPMKKVEIAQSASKKQEKDTEEQYESSQQWQKVRPLSIEFDQKCMYYSKFKIEQKKISSLCEDYYQIYNKQPLPKKGIYKTRVKMIGENHLSIGILGESALNNQYSFQNKQVLCFYSYHYGNFRGCYYRTKYEPISWPIELGQIFQLQIDMNRKLLKFRIHGKSETQAISFKDLYLEQNLYFFVEMYQKNNIIQFLQ